MPSPKNPNKKQRAAAPSKVIKAAPIQAVAPAPVEPKLLTLRRDIFGWLDLKSNSDKPVHAPPPVSPCIVCCQPLSNPFSIQYVPWPKQQRRYFYVAHKVCWDGITDKEKKMYDKSLLRLLEQGAV